MPLKLPLPVVGTDAQPSPKTAAEASEPEAAESVVESVVVDELLVVGAAPEVAAESVPELQAARLNGRARATAARTPRLRKFMVFSLGVWL